METARCKCLQPQTGSILEYPDGHKEHLCARCKGLIRREPDEVDISLDDLKDIDIAAWKMLFPILLVALTLVSCVRPTIPAPPETVPIRVICPSCLAGQQVGYAPLTLYFYVDVAGEVTWDFGDGTRGVGKLVEHTYTDAGLYKVTMVATAEKQRRKATLKAQTYVKVLERATPARQQVVIPNALAQITVLAPKRLGLGERSLLCVYISPRRDVVVVDMQAAENDALLAGGELFHTWLYVPTGAIIEHCFSVRGFRVGEGRVQFIFFVADNMTGRRSDAAITIGVEDTGARAERGADDRNRVERLSR
jgi:hypothetical protein